MNFLLKIFDEHLGKGEGKKLILTWFNSLTVNQRLRLKGLNND